jgi:hypothetical protein
MNALPPSAHAKIVRTATVLLLLLGPGCSEKGSGSSNDGAAGQGVAEPGASAETLASTLPDSLYLSGPPAFFNGYRWPWVDPTTGTVHKLPAQER